MTKDKTRVALGRRFSTQPATLFDDRIDEELRFAHRERSSVASGSSTDKKNYAESLSRALAQRFADALRQTFSGILPGIDGSGQESKARTGKGLKKLDVNYSTVELGLGLGVSIKTINFRDAKTRRYTKNYTRVDNELRAEASDYHERQPYAVLCAAIFLPLDACDDGSKNTPSSFGQAVQIFRFRAGREMAADNPTLFERVLIGLYDSDSSFGRVCFFDVMDDPPKTGKPRTLKSFREAIDAIVEAYDRRNKAKFKWADGDTEILTNPVLEPNGDEES